MTTSPKVRLHRALNGVLVTVVETIPGDGSPHDFRVSRTVSLGHEPLHRMPSVAEIAVMLDSHLREPSPAVAALVAALHHVSQELGVVARESPTHARWALRLREFVETELQAVHPFPPTL
jgi:hypothetical protein